MPNELSRLLTPQETAGLLGLAVGTLAVWRCTRRVVLPFVRAGRLIRYDPRDVAAFVASRREPAEAKAAAR